MYEVWAKYPRLDNRDAIVGTTRARVSGLPAYETVGMARKMANMLEIPPWERDFDDPHFYVIDSATRVEVRLYTILSKVEEAITSELDERDPFED